MLALRGKNKITKRAIEIVDLIAKGLREGNVAAIDVTDAWEDIQKIKGFGYMHEKRDKDMGDIVECYIAPVDFTVNGESIKKGTWLLGVVWAPEYFEKVESGEITGYSMGGKGRRIREGGSQHWNQLTQQF